jgi:hypothetical protein
MFCNVNIRNAERRTGPAREIGVDVAVYPMMSIRFGKHGLNVFTNFNHAVGANNNLGRIALNIISGRKPDEDEEKHWWMTGLRGTDRVAEEGRRMLKSK